MIVGSKDVESFVSKFFSDDENFETPQDEPRDPIRSIEKKLSIPRETIEPRRSTRARKRKIWILDSYLLSHWVS